MSGGLRVVHLDGWCAVIDKPGGLLSVPGRGPDKQDSVVSRLRSLLPWCLAQPAVHRLDMATSGLMVLALTAPVHRHLSAQFARRQVAKEYVALLDGRVDGEGGEIRLAFRLDPDDRPRQVYDPEGGKEGVTRWQRIGERHGRTLVRFEPRTGRTHQLRLHAAHPLGLGCPIVGDSLYGHGCPGDRLLLHSAALQFMHPATGELLTFASPPPFL